MRDTVALLVVALLLGSSGVVDAVSARSQLSSESAASANTHANPIRKVVTLMQNMQKEIEAEGEKEKELFEKFMCFCGSSGGDLDKSVADSRAKIEELSAKLKSESAEKIQTVQDVAQHKTDREGAKHDLSEAAGIREKEAAEYGEMAADSKTNIKAMANAIPALEKGLAGASLLQLPELDRVHRLVETYPSVQADDRSTVLAFLDQSSGETGSSDQIIGILKQMKDEMEADFKQATDEENQAQSSFNQLKSSKEEEVKLASQGIEIKTVRSGELAVSVVQTRDALEDEQEELSDAEKFAANLKEQCGSKQDEWDARCKARSEEIAAVSEAIKILNDDSALEVFKKAIPSASAIQTGSSFLQRHSAHASPVHKVRAILSELAGSHPSPQVGLMLFTLSSKLKLKQGTENFDEVVQMINDMLTLLGKQQKEDDKKKDWCYDEFDKSEDEEKATKTKIEDLEAGLGEMSDSITQLSDDINTLTKEIASLDKAVAEATEQRKAEHSDFVELVQMNEVAKTLVDKARNRMQKFYNPSLYKPDPKAAAFQQSSSSVAPPQAPETFSGEVKKNAGGSGVIGMMDDIVHDLEMGTQEAKMEEKTAQRDYNQLMKDSQVKRAENADSITNKEANKADLEIKLQETKQNHRDANEDLAIVQKYITDLHGSCDFLQENYDVRKEARANELDGLNSAKAVLSGANFGF